MELLANNADRTNTNENYENDEVLCRSNTGNSPSIKPRILKGVRSE
jgi:hypothetical protein